MSFNEDIILNFIQRGNVFAVMTNNKSFVRQRLTSCIDDCCCKVNSKNPELYSILVVADLTILQKIFSHFPKIQKYNPNPNQ